ncbi:MAG: hypothetical protein MK116_08970 [Phycisphaerales bacterium]|nr:hypothetical protein [Phycisphaerales bacterium]
MGLMDDAAADAAGLGAQMIYFKIKNGRRAKAFTKWSAANGFTFWAKPANYDGEIMKLPIADAEAAKARGGRPLGAKARMASRFFGESQMQTRLWAFCTNRFRGDWQTNANIIEGQWNGTLMTAFDTLWFELATQQATEGEYSSVFAHCKSPLPRMIITPGGFLAGLKRLDEGQSANWGYHRITFETNEFNKNWHVTAADEKLAYAFVSQKMMEFLMDHQTDKWHMELSEGGLLISTIFTLKPPKIEKAMNFINGFLQHVDEDLLETRS